MVWRRRRDASASLWRLWRVLGLFRNGIGAGWSEGQARWRGRGGSELPHALDAALQAVALQLQLHVLLHQLPPRLLQLPQLVRRPDLQRLAAAVDLVDLALQLPLGRRQGLLLGLEVLVVPQPAPRPGLAGCVGVGGTTTRTCKKRDTIFLFRKLAQDRKRKIKKAKK